MFAGLCCDRIRALRHFLGIAACGLAAACSSPSNEAPSYEVQAIQASDAGDQKTAIKLAAKEVARFSTPDQCSPTKSINCGTLALAYSSLAKSQILGGDRASGESSFSSARRALGLMDRRDRASATAMVYGDVSEAFWKVGDRARAVAVFKEGRAAGGDSYLFLVSAAQAASHEAERGR
jgi:L-asparaginase II